MQLFSAWLLNMVATNCGTESRTPREAPKGRGSWLGQGHQQLQLFCTNDCWDSVRRYSVSLTASQCLVRHLGNPQVWINIQYLAINIINMRSGFGRFVNYRLFWWNCQYSLCFFMHLGKSDKLLTFFFFLIKMAYNVTYFFNLLQVQNNSRRQISEI